MISTLLMEIPGNRSNEKLQLAAEKLAAEINTLLDLLKRPLDTDDVEEGWTPELQSVVVEDLRALYEQVCTGQISRRNLARDLDNDGIVGGRRSDAIGKASLRILELYDDIASH